MSRRPPHNQSVRSSNAAEDYVHFIEEHAISITLTSKETEEATINDKVVQEDIKCMASGNWQHSKVSKELKKFYNVRHEFSVAQDYDVSLRGCRNIISYPLHQSMQLPHECHQDVIKGLVLSKIWYLGIDRVIEKLVLSCIRCQANVIENKLTFCICLQPLLIHGQFQILISVVHF